MVRLDGRVVKCNGLQIRKIVSSNLTLGSKKIMLDTSMLRCYNKTY